MRLKYLLFFLIIFLVLISGCIQQKEEKTTTTIQATTSITTKQTTTTTIEPTVTLKFIDETNNCSMNGDVTLNGNTIGSTENGIFILTFHDYSLYRNISGNDTFCISGFMGSCFPEYSDWLYERCWVNGNNETFGSGIDIYNMLMEVQPKYPMGKEMINFVRPNSVKSYIDQISTWFVNDTEKDLDSIQQYVSQEIRYTVIPHVEWRTPVETLQSEGYGDCKDRATTFVSLAKAQNPSVQCFCVGWDTRKNELGHLTAFCKVKNHFIFYDYGKTKTWISTGESVETSEILSLLNQYISDYGLPVVSEVRYAFDDKNYYEFNNSLEFVEWVKKL